jgi:hypothetical protein
MKELYEYNREMENIGLLEDLVFGTKEYEQHKEFRG